MTALLTQKLIQTCLVELPKKITPKEKAAASQCLIDSLACAYAAYKEPAIDMLMQAYLEHPPSTGCSVIGYASYARADDAALINGAMVSLQLFDDNQAQMRGHPSGRMESHAAPRPEILKVVEVLPLGQLDPGAVMEYAPLPKHPVIPLELP